MIKSWTADFCEFSTPPGPAIPYISLLWTPPPPSHWENTEPVKASVIVTLHILLSRGYLGLPYTGAAMLRDFQLCVWENNEKLGSNNK